jgi:hypothetical protein
LYGLYNKDLKLRREEEEEEEARATRAVDIDI